MREILILGNGVAAISMLYQLSQKDIPCYVISPNHMQQPVGGAYFVHLSDSVSLHRLMYEARLTPGIVELSGGVDLYDNGEIIHHPWTSLIKDYNLRLELTKLYAAGTGRTWSKSIMNNILEQEDMPCGLIAPSYKEIIEYMLECINGLETIDQLPYDVSTIDTYEQTVQLSNGDQLPYDIIINTLPLWVLHDKLMQPLPISNYIGDTKPRYAAEEMCTSSELSMTYCVGPEVLEVSGFPLKRISTINNFRVYEFFEKPDTTHIYSNTIKEIPPNITNLSPAKQSFLMSHLAEASIIPLGRFARMESKMMLTDIIDQAYDIANVLDQRR